MNNKKTNANGDTMVMEFNPAFPFIYIPRKDFEYLSRAINNVLTYKLNYDKPCTYTAHADLRCKIKRSCDELREITNNNNIRMDIDIDLISGDGQKYTVTLKHE